MLNLESPRNLKLTYRKGKGKENSWIVIKSFRMGMALHQAELYIYYLRT